MLGTQAEKCGQQTAQEGSKKCLEGAKTIYLAATRREAIRRFRHWASEWRSSQPKAVACLETDLDELLNFLTCPKAHWRKVRTTNAIDRPFREARRRTRPMICSQNQASVDRIIYGVIGHLDSSWNEKPIAQLTHFS